MGLLKFIKRAFGAEDNLSDSIMETYNVNSHDAQEIAKSVNTRLGDYIRVGYSPAAVKPDENGNFDIIVFSVEEDGK